MNVPGYCTGCRRIKRVRVTNAALVTAIARGTNTAQGLCADCEYGHGEEAPKR